MSGVRGTDTKGDVVMCFVLRVMKAKQSDAMQYHEPSGTHLLSKRECRNMV